MAQRPTPATRICPECGAAMRYDSTHCWLCAYKATPISLKRPVAVVPIEVEVPPLLSRNPTGSIVGFVISLVLLFAALPVAAMIALFCVCVADASQGNLYRNNNLEMVILLGGGTFVVLGTLGMSTIYFFTKLLR